MGGAGAPWPALPGEVSFVCALTEDLQSVLTANLGRTSVLEGIFGSFFTWEGCFLDWGGGCLPFFCLSFRP